MDRIYPNDEDAAIRAGATRESFQQQQKALKTPAQDQPAELRESLHRLDEARERLAEAEADAAQKAGLVHQWETLLQKRDQLGDRLRQLQTILVDYKKSVEGIRGFLFDNLGNPYEVRVHDAWTNLVCGERAVQLIPEIIEQKEKAYTAAQAAIVEFAHAHGLEHLLAPKDREPKRK